VRNLFGHTLAIAAALALSANTHAQTGTVKFDQISLEQGLSQSTVNAIVQDGQGFLWFGTQDGLNKYDGYTVTVFKHTGNDSLTVSDNGIWSLCRDTNGDIWIGTMRGGLSRYSIERGTFTHYRHNPDDPTSISDDNVTAVFLDSRGILWAGTLTRGLNRYDPETGDFLHFENDARDSTSLADNTVWTIAEDAQGRIWIATWGGVCRYLPPEPGDSIGSRTSSGSFVRYRHRTSNPATPAGDNIRTLLIDRRQRIWIGAWDRGLDCYDPAAGTFRHFQHSPDNPQSVSSNKILSLREDADGMLWVGTNDAGLNLLDPSAGIARRFTHDPSVLHTLNNNIICSLYDDQAGTLWIGTGAGGVNRYDRLKNRFAHYRSHQNTPGDLSGNDVWALLEDHSGALWIGTYGNGLNRLDRSSGVFTHFDQNQGGGRGLSHNIVLALCESRDGTLWIGTEGGGLNRLDRRSGVFTHYRHDPRNDKTIAQDEVTVLLEDRNGMLWIGSNGSGLDRLDPATGRISHFPPNEKNPHALPAGSILSLFEDRAGMIWIGMYAGGLARFNPADSSLTRFPYDPTTGNGINNSTVLSLYEDSAGVLWVGTYGGGLNRYDRRDTSWRYVTEANGLPNNVIYGILPDNRGNLWLPTNKGLARYTPANGAVRVFDVSDGLQGNEFNQGAYYRGKQGEMFLGGINGFNVFHPDSIADNRIIPQVYLTSFKVFDRDIPLPRSLSVMREIELSHDRNSLSFEFVALNYTSPSKNQYAYKLDGLDEEWIRSGTRRYVSYTNLDPGRYTLRVRGSNNDGIWNELGATLAITIVPPYWRTWWFRVLAIAAIAGILFLMYRYRVNKLLEIERIRTSIATDLHDDIGSTLTEIALYSDVGLRELKHKQGSRPLLEDERAKVSSLFTEIGTTSRTLIDAMNDIVWAIDPKNDSFEFLLLRMKMHATKMLEAKGINYDIDIPSEIASLRLPLNFRRRFFLIYKEALNNIIRHAKAKRVVLTLRREGRMLVMTIADDGIGFDTRDGSQGNGLLNMQQRARSLGGELTLASAPGVGTTVTLRAAIP